VRSKVNISAAAVLGSVLVVGSNRAALASPGQTGHWQTPAQWHRLLKKAVPGTLLLDDDGVEFRSAKFNQRWAYVEIHGFDLSTRELTVTSYQSRHWHEPGERRFQFTLSEPMPPEIAAQFTERVGKPVRNGVPLPSVVAIAEIPAHHRMWSGGSSGTLRLKDSGIDYVTENGRDSRAWRWADIQTIANPNPYELRVMAYREIVEFDLKQPISRDLFDLVWDHLYAAGLNLSSSEGGEHR
jgi:hypothetical protein